jgi:hypothetical protein
MGGEHREDLSCLKDKISVWDVGKSKITNPGRSDVAASNRYLAIELKGNR